jgi:hypothetical protein
MGKAHIGGNIIDRKEVGAPGAFESMRSDEIEAALLKVLQDHGVTVSAGEADEDKPR